MGPCGPLFCFSWLARCKIGRESAGYVLRARFCAPSCMAVLATLKPLAIHNLSPRLGPTFLGADFEFFRVGGGCCREIWRKWARSLKAQRRTIRTARGALSAGPVVSAPCCVPSLFWRSPVATPSLHIMTDDGRFDDPVFGHPPEIRQVERGGIRGCDSIGRFANSPQCKVAKPQATCNVSSDYWA